MRRLLFASVVLVLLGSLALVLVGLGGAPTANHRGPRRSAAVSRSAMTDAPPPDPAARPDARRFLTAFLAFEAGRDTPRTRRAIRSTSGHDLARQILAAPRTTGRGRQFSAGHLHALRLRRLPSRPGLLLASGTAIRPEGPEPFSFIFARRRGRWLAIAPGE